MALSAYSASLILNRIEYIELPVSVINDPSIDRSSDLIGGSDACAGVGGASQLLLDSCLSIWPCTSSSHNRRPKVVNEGPLTAERRIEAECWEPRDQPDPISCLAPPHFTPLAKLLQEAAVHQAS